MQVSRSVYLAEMQSIPGWFDPLDASLMCAISEHQRANDMIGDILEIGVFEGRSTILLGYLIDEGERLVACDPFDDASDIGDENRLWNRRFYPGLTQQAFERNYLRYHPELPQVATMPSARVGALVAPASLRLIHVDGAHDYATVRNDARLSRQLSMPGGVTIFDDYSKAHLPGVAMAVWEQILTHGFVPVALTDAKLYGCWGDDDAAALRDHLATQARSMGSGVRVDDHQLGEWSVPRIVPRPPPLPWLFEK